MSPAPLPPLYSQTRQLTVLSEQAVMQFCRYHQYSVGAVLLERGLAQVRADQTGYLRHATQLRTVGEWFLPAPAGWVEQG